MIQCIDTRDTARQVRVGALDVGHELGFRAAGTGDQDCAGRSECRGNFLEKALIGRGVSAVSGVGLMVQMLMWMGAAHDLAVRSTGIEMEDLRLLMIDPD